MFCDCVAAAERHKNGDPYKSLEINTERFSFTPQLKTIWKNTLDMLAGDNPNNSVHMKIENNNSALTDYVENHILNPKNCTVFLESTGDYHRTPTIFFLRKGFKVKILNPILTKQFTNATIRKKKTDKTDTEIIMKLALAGEGDEITLEEINNPTKELLRLSHFLVKLRTQLKLKLQSVKHKDLAGEVVEDELLNLIDRMTEIVESLDAEALQEKDEQVNLVDSIPGFSAKLSQILISECGDLTKYKNANALVAYAGLDPKIKQSGNSTSYGRLTKRGPRFLRYALFLAARVAWRYDPDLYNYYEKKRGEGRSFTETICMIARKLLHRAYVVVKEQRSYEIRL
jgi:transposase